MYNKKYYKLNVSDLLVSKNAICQHYFWNIRKSLTLLDLLTTPKKNYILRKLWNFILIPWTKEEYDHGIKILQNGIRLHFRNRLVLYQNIYQNITINSSTYRTEYTVSFSLIMNFEFPILYVTLKYWTFYFKQFAEIWLPNLLL